MITLIVGLVVGLLVYSIFNNNNDLEDKLKRLTYDREILLSYDYKENVWVLRDAHGYLLGYDNNLNKLAERVS